MFDYITGREIYPHEKFCGKGFVGASNNDGPGIWIMIRLIFK